MTIWKKFVGLFIKKAVEVSIPDPTLTVADKIHEEQKEVLKKALKARKPRAKKAKNENAQ